MTKKKEKKNTETGENIDDVVFENENEQVSGFGGKKSDQKLKAKIKKLEEEKNEYLDGWQRARAEMANLKKNHAEEKKMFTALGKETMIAEILAPLDNFEAAFANKEAWEKVDDAWRMGVEYIYSQFIAMLENNGVSQFGTVGDDFDESLHLSVENIDTEDDTQDGKIAEIVQRGYRSGDKIIREAKVKTFVKK